MKMSLNRTAIQVFEAIERIIQNAKLGEIEEVELSLTDGRVMAEDLVAKHPIPHFNRSAFDGYAIRSIDSQGASFDQCISLKVVDYVPAGQVSERMLQSGEAIRIMTGAQMPEGADAVIGIELVKEITKGEEKWIEINRAVPIGQHIAYIGEDTQEGTILAHKGRVISAGEMAMLATYGYHNVKVYKQPRVGVFVTGTELLSVEQELEPGKIRNSNSYMLLSQIRKTGAIPKYYGILPDDFDLCYQAITKAFTEVDYLITTGGASVGDFDYVQDLIEKLGAERLFNKVAMRPGSVTTVATLGDKWFFGLSGNPSACFVGFELFMRPVLKKAVGAEHIHLPRSKAKILHDVEKPNLFTRFIRAKAEVKGHEVFVSSTGVDKSGVASSLIEANTLLVIPGGTKEIKKDDLVEIIWLDRPVEGTIYV